MKVIRITDAGQATDIAIFAVTGTFVEWITTEERVNVLLFLAGQQAPQLVDRSFLKMLALIGQPPVYPLTYTGPKTSAADFAIWVS